MFLVFFKCIVCQFFADLTIYAPLWATSHINSESHLTKTWKSPYT